MWHILLSTKIVSAVTLTELVLKVREVIINPVIKFIFALAMVIFVFGIVRYFFAGTQGKVDTEKTRSMLIWGVVGMAIMASAYGLLALIANTVGAPGVITQ